MSIGKTHASNLVELLDRDALCGLLTQCGVESVAKFSDYELFRAFCGVWDLLDGHRQRKKCSYLLEQVLDLPQDISQKNCDRIWKESSTRLFFAKLRPEFSIESTCEVSPNCNKSYFTFERLPRMDAVIYRCNSILRMRAPTWEAWREQVEQNLASFIAAPDAALYYRLPRSYTDRAPNPYLVGRIAPKRDRNKEERNLLHAQILRHLFSFCVREDRPLLLSASCKKADLEGLLKRLTAEIGTPRLICAPTDFHTMSAIAARSAQDTKISLGMDLREQRSEDLSAEFFCRIAENYPIGRLFLIPK